jgi:hypothetical protein
MAINKKEIEEQELESGSQNYYILGEPLIDPEKSKYLNHPAPKKKKQKNYKNAEKGAPNRDKPTTASGKKGLKDLPSLMASVDPKGISSVAPMMYQMLGQISSASKGGSQSSRKKTVEDAFTGALSILANKYTFDYLTLVFDNALKDNKIKLITVEYQEVVKNALANLYTNYIQYGDGNFPVNEYIKITEIGEPPENVVTIVPDLYIQQYYIFEKDPYPGYIQWLSPDEVESVYTERKIGDYYYPSADEEIYSEAELKLSIELEPYVSDNNLTASILNDLLISQESEIEASSEEKNNGKNSSKQLVDTLLKLAGYAGVISNLQQKLQLPISVLNQGAIKKSTDAFMKNIGKIKQEKEKAKKAAQPLSPISALGNLTSALGSVSGALGSVSGALGPVSGALGSVSGALGSVSGAVSSVTGAVGSVSGAINSVSSISSITGAVDSINQVTYAAQRVTSLSSSAKNLYDTIKS